MVAPASPPGRKPVKLFKIGELMEYSGLSRQTIHNYTMLGLIKAARRTKAGHRLYGEEVFEILERITALKRDHTLSEIRDILQGKAPADEPQTTDGEADPQGPREHGQQGNA